MYAFWWRMAELIVGLWLTIKHKVELLIGCF